MDLDKIVNRITIRFCMVVSIFFVLTAVFLKFNLKDNVFWEIYAFSLKDFFIVGLSFIFFGLRTISDLFIFGLTSYLSVPFLIRTSCAVESEMNYSVYRALIENTSYSYFLLIVLLLISTLIYYGCKNERKI